MDYTTFKNKVQNFPFIASKDIVRLVKNKQVMLNQLRRWREKGLLIELRKGMYVLNDSDRKINPSRSFFANQVYSPSYVSLEYALQYYDFIPERVFEVTSVTTKKTARFKNNLGSFIYRHISPKAFRGFTSVKGGDGPACFIALPEKAIVDFLYFTMQNLKDAQEDVFTASYRFQHLELLKPKKILYFAGLYANRKLLLLAKRFCDFIAQEEKK